MSEQNEVKVVNEMPSHSENNMQAPKGKSAPISKERQQEIEEILTV